MLQIVTIEQARSLREIGFDYPSSGFYEKNQRTNEWYYTDNWKHTNFNKSKDQISAPETALALRWINANGLTAWVFSMGDDWGYHIKRTDESLEITKTTGGISPSYDEAESDCLTKCLEILLYLRETTK